MEGQGRVAGEWTGEEECFGEDRSSPGWGGWDWQGRPPLYPIHPPESEYKGLFRLVTAV